MMNLQQLAPIIQLMKGKDPKQMVMQMAKNQKINNPVIEQLINFANTGDNTNFEKLANDFFKQQGVDAQEFQSFIDLMK